MGSPTIEIYFRRGKFGVHNHTYPLCTMLIRSGWVVPWLGLRPTQLYIYFTTLIPKNIGEIHGERDGVEAGANVQPQ